MAMLESRCKPGEKLTETLGIKMTETMLRRVSAVAESHGLDAPKWVRTLIEDALDRERERFQVLSGIFGQADRETKSAAERCGALDGQDSEGVFR